MLMTDTHDKELLTIFEAFKHWQQYLKGSGTLIDVVTDHKNLEYFSTTKLLTHQQACWSEFLSQFNMVICFHPGKLGTKPNALTRHWDVYCKGGNSDFASVNPSNMKPIFTQDQFKPSLHATYLTTPIICNAIIMDIEKLHEDIQNSLSNDPISATHLSTPESPNWTIDESGLLRQNNRIYVPDSVDLQLRVIQYNHDHILSGHFGQNKTIELIHCKYIWPNLRTMVKHFCNSCTTCKHSKAPRHKPYGLLKQLPVPVSHLKSVSGKSDMK